MGSARRTGILAGMRSLHAVVLFFLCAGCSALPLHPHIEEQAVGLEQSFRGAAYGAGGRMWSSGSNGTVLHRGSGDDSWSRAAFPAASLDLRDIDVRRNGGLFAMAAGPGDASVLYVSESLGAHWERVLSNPDAEGFFDSVAFDPSGHGMLVGDPLAGAFTIFTSERGRTWTRVEPARSPEAADGEHAFAASGSILIATDDDTFWFASGGSRARIWRTRDRGLTWFDAGAPDTGGTASAGWFGLGSDGRGTIVAVGGDYERPKEPSTAAVLRQSAGWVSFTLPGFRSAVAAVPELAGVWVAVGSDGADWSRDDGRSWQPLDLPGGHALAPAGPGALLVVGGPEQPHRVVRFDG